MINTNKRLPRVWHNKGKLLEIPLKNTAEKVLSWLSEEDKQRIANLPKYLVSANLWLTGIYFGIINSNKFDYYFSDNGYEVNNNKDQVVMIIKEDIWYLLQRDSRYVGELRDPWSGELLPEKLRYHSNMPVSVFRYAEEYFHDFSEELAETRKNMAEPVTGIRLPENLKNLTDAQFIKGIKKYVRSNQFYLDRRVDPPLSLEEKKRYSVW